MALELGKLAIEKDSGKATGKKWETVWGKEKVKELKRVKGSGKERGKALCLLHMS